MSARILVVYGGMGMLSADNTTDQVLFTTGGGRWQLEVWKLENYQPAARTATAP
jgi:hypothetical protein